MIDGSLVDNIIEKRVAEGNFHKIELQMSDKQFDYFYDDLDTESAHDLLRTYLDSKADDGRPENIGYKYDSNSHIIRITADLRYIGNNHTEYMNRHRDSTFD